VFGRPNFCAWARFIACQIINVLILIGLLNTATNELLAVSIGRGWLRVLSDADLFAPKQSWPPGPNQLISCFEKVGNRLAIRNLDNWHQACLLQRYAKIFLNR
jgi:hypothetical protein